MMLNIDAYHTMQPPLRSVPVTLTTDYVAVHSGNCILEFLAFANADTGAIQVYAQDGASHTLLPGISVSAGTTEFISIPDGGIYFPGGLKLKASVGAKVDAWFRIRPA
jgi:hypothetical protein